MLGILGWIWLGVVIGIVLGFVLSAIIANRKIADLESEIDHLRFVRESLKQEIFRLENKAKPIPRKNRKKM